MEFSLVAAINIAKWIIIPALFFFVAAKLFKWELNIPWNEIKATFSKKWSTWLNGAGIANLLMVLPVDPVTGLSLWNMMPANVRALLPANALMGVGLSLWVLAWLATFIRQKKVEAAQNKVANQ